MRAAGFCSRGFFWEAAAIRHRPRGRHPLLDLTALRVQTFAATVLWGSATRIGIEAVPYLLPLLFQIGFGRLSLPFRPAAAGGGHRQSQHEILHHEDPQAFGFRSVAVFNGGIAALFIIGCGWLAPSTPLAIMMVILLAYGLARSLQFTTLATLAYADVTDAQKSAASTLWSVAQQMTIGMGIAFGALCLRISASLHHSGAETGPVQFTLQDFRWAFAMAGLLTLCSIIGYIRLPRDAGSTIGGGTRPVRIVPQNRG